VAENEPTTAFAPEFSATLRLDRERSVGAKLTGLTVNAKLSDALKLPSLTARVMVDDPVWPATGDRLIKQLSTVPERVTLSAGISVVLEELGVMELQLRAESGSEIETETPVKVVS
jgi:hypothetical protein